MADHNPSNRNYWNHLHEAEVALQAGDFAPAERSFELAVSLRAESPGRVFVTEKIRDGLSRALRRGKSRPARPGHWEKQVRAFRNAFLARGETVVRQGVRLAELRPEDEAEANQPVLEKALFLVGRSKLFTEEPASAVPLLKGLFRTSLRTGRPFAVDFIRHDIPLTEEDRLWLAGRGMDLLDEFIGQDTLSPGSLQAAEWSNVFLQLVHARYFGSSGRLQEERAWLEAVLADRLLGRPQDSVDLLRAYLAEYPAPGLRADEARVRLVELLANTDALHFPVPLYEEALGALQSAGLAAGSLMANRFKDALARIDYRCPETLPASGEPPVWASVALEPGGEVAVTLWWDDQPRDMAFWRAGEDPAPLNRFLKQAAGRLIALNPELPDMVANLWEYPVPLFTVGDFAAALLEKHLPAAGLDAETLVRLALGETAAWRLGWDAQRGHPCLTPPQGSGHVADWARARGASSIQTGLIWLAIRNRVRTADPTLRAGIGELSRRGDGAAFVLYEFLTLDRAAPASLDAAFEPWTLPLLWTRPDPFGWAATGRPIPGPVSTGESRLDLGHNDLAIVSTGDPAAILGAWGDSQQKWRVVLDRLDRLEQLSHLALGAIGPVTLIPPAGRVHSLSAALALLEDLLQKAMTATDPVDGLLPIFHWCRLVETHNGDLLDFRQTRPRASGTLPLHDIYVQVISDLAKDEPRLDDEGAFDTWGAQYSQRVRKAGFVAGLAHELYTDPDRLDSVWGVFEGSDASWVFLDSAAIHWQLLGGDGSSLNELHGLLFSRGHRHLSLLTGALWMREELEDLLGTWLGVYGRPYCLGMTDTRIPLLRLAAHGVVPDARVGAARALASQVARIRDSFAVAGGGTVLLPGQGRSGEFWHQVASGELPFADSSWSFVEGAASVPVMTGDDPAAGNLLLVPVLASLEGGQPPIAQADTHQEWRIADGDRRAYIDWRRKLCGLELASLMAGPWGIVEILDTRWWRLFPAVVETAAGGPAETPVLPSAARLAPPESLTFDLPGFGPGSKATVLDRLLPAIGQWLQARSGSPQAPVGSDALPLTDVGATLLVGADDAAWQTLGDQLSRVWEEGQLDKWLLLVSDSVPVGAAELVAASWSGGGSVWPFDEAGDLPAPLVWAQPTAFGDKHFIAFLKQNKPAIILARGVEAWLPAVGRSGQMGALALRSMLDCNPEKLILQADSLAPLWCDFLAGICGARVQVGGKPVVSDDPVKEPAAGEPACLDCGRPARPQIVVRRLRRLLSRLKPDLFLPAGQENQPLARGSDRQLVSLEWLAHLTGISGPSLLEGTLLLRWAARLAGDTLSDAAAGLADTGQPALGHALLVPFRFAEMENTLSRLDENLAVIFPLLLGADPRGLPVWVDLDFPPIRLDSADLALVDRLLATAAMDIEGRTRLIYACPRGVLNSSRRLIGCHGAAGETLTWLREWLRQFQRRVADVMGKAVETGDGFRVDTGLLEIRPEERDFLAMGAELGLWRWDGPVCPGAMHLVDLLTLADSPTVREGRAAWSLLAQMIARDWPAAAAVEPDDPDGESRGRGAAGGALDKLRAIIPGTDPNQDLVQVVKRLGDLLDPGGDPGLLVIKGLCGTGRHDALCRALQDRITRDGDCGQVTFYCPDLQTAARLTGTASRRGLNLPLDIRIPGDNQALVVPRREPGLLAGPGTNVIVICEAQRFEPEVRYRIAEIGRGCRLLMTIDPAGASEPWEHLFLTTPRTGDIVELETQRRVARTLWTHVREMVPEDLRGRGNVTRRDKGTVTVDYAVNLDQCLSRIVQEVDQGNLPKRLHISGPLQADLEFLAGALRERGWLALPVASLDRLLLPGPREIMAVFSDLLALIGKLPSNRIDGDADDGDEAVTAPENENDRTGPPARDESPPQTATLVPDLKGSALLTPQLLGPEAGRQYLVWLDALDRPEPAVTLAELLSLMAPCPWARSVLALPEVEARVGEMIAIWGVEKLEDLPRLSTWEAWWYTLQDDLGRRDGTLRRPLVTYGLATDPGGEPCPGGVYLCLGTEPALTHYHVLSRVTDQSLILYKDQSPLPAPARG